MVTALDTIKTKKAGQLKTELNNYTTGKAQAIQQIKQNSIFAQNGSNVSFSSNTSIFNDPRLKGGTDSAAAQSNENQKAGADSSSINMSTIMTKVNDAINDVVQKFNTVIDNIKNSIAELSAMASPQISGQNVNPNENMPLDNQGTDNKTGSKDSQKPQVGFGEETIEDKEDKNKIEKDEDKENINEAKSSSDIDKATLKKIDEQYTKHYQMGTNNIDSIFKSAEDLAAATT